MSAWLIAVMGVPWDRAWAQAPAVPSAVVPGLIGPQGSPIGPVLPPVRPQVAPGLPTPGPVPPQAVGPGPTARVTSVTVNGSTVYGPAVTGPLLEGLTGPAVPQARVEQAREQLVARYRADGYLLTTVTSVRDAQGNLRFNVVEGYISDVKLAGYTGPGGSQVLRFLRRLMEERPIRISTLERYLLLATDVPGMTVRTTLGRSADEPGAITLTANITRKAVDGLFAADNRAFRSTGPEQLLAVAAFNSFSSLGERTEISILHSFNNTQLFGQASTEFFAGSSGLKVRLYGGAGTTVPSDPLRSLGYDGRTKVFGVLASYPIIRRREQTLAAVLALDAIESEIKTTGVLGPQRTSFDSLRVVRTGLDYNLFDVALGGDRQGITSIGFRVSKGITGLGATVSGDGRRGGRAAGRTS